MASYALMQERRKHITQRKKPSAQKLVDKLSIRQPKRNVNL